MSTRRPRIKAVAALPVRRKNTDNNDAKAKTPSSSLPKPAEVRPSIECVSKVAECPGNEKQPTLKLQDSKTDDLGNQNKQCPAETSAPLNKTDNVSIPTVPNIEKSAKNLSPLLSPQFTKSCPKINSPGKPRILPSLVPLTATQKSPVTFSARNQLGLTPTQGSNKEDATDFNPPSIPESLTDEVIDGIVPLKTAQNAPKPIDLLKNVITSDNVEVLFDPIVPLPSPSKVRPKLRPAPRLPLRRNSVHGSASESEDETRRALLGGSTTPAPSRQRHDSLNLQSAPNKDVVRVRNDSLSTPASQSMTQPSQSVPASPLREKNISKSRRNEISRRMLMLRRRQRMLKAVRDVKRNELTMYDLIFYNPLTNPIVPEKDDTETVEGTKFDTGKETSKSTEVEDKAVEEDHVQEEQTPDDLLSADDDNSAPVPQIKLGPNGEIILDEQSLVIEQTESSRKLSESIVHESAYSSQGRGKYVRSKRTADWTDAETVRFYRALASVGTDFTLMEPMFPGRTRRDLKFKFKKEERLNGAQIDKALRSQTQWDGMRLETVFAKERRDDADRAEKERAEYVEHCRLEKLKLKQMRREGVKLSRAAKAMVSSVEEGFKNRTASLTADAIIKLSQKQNKPNINKPTPSPKPPQTSPFASLNSNVTIAKVNKNQTPRGTPKSSVISDLVTITPVKNKQEPVPNTIESGSLVVVTADDPKDPTKKVLQTYLSVDGKLTPVTLPSSLLTSVVGYMKRGTPSTQSSTSSPLFSPNSNSMGSQENSRSSVIQFNPTPSKRMRHDSYNITQL